MVSERILPVRSSSLIPTRPWLVGKRLAEKKTMKCHTCGSNVQSILTDLPFKLGESALVILKGLPVGAVKVMLTFSKWPLERRTSLIAQAIQQEVDFLFSADPATAAYPTG